MLSLLWTLFDNWYAPAPPAHRVQWLKEWGYAHRGLHGEGVPENSSLAFEKAIAENMGIELDVQRSREGQPMVFHDWSLDRMTDQTGLLAKRDAADIETITLSGSSETIPQLNHILDQVAGQVPLLIELKLASDRAISLLCLAVRRALEGYQGKHAVMSLNPKVSRWFEKHSPHTIRGLVIRETGEFALRSTRKRRSAMWSAKPDFLAYNVLDLPSKFAAAQRKRGLPLLAWVVRSDALNTAAVEHADAMIAECVEDM